MKKYFAFIFIVALAVSCNRNANQNVFEQKGSTPDQAVSLQPQASLEELLVGKWLRSGSNQIVEYKADHSAVVYKDEKQTDMFNWEVTDEIKNKNIGYKSIPGEKFIKEFSSVGTGRYYSIMLLDNMNLKLIYTYNGLVLNYKRVEP